MKEKFFHLYKDYFIFRNSENWKVVNINLENRIFVIRKNHPIEDIRRVKF